MPRREQYQTRLDNDTAEKVDEYQDERDLSKAEAVRRLIKEGLESLDDPDDDGPSNDDVLDQMDQLKEMIQDDDTDTNDYRIRRSLLFLSGSGLGTLLYFIDLSAPAQLAALLLLSIPLVLAMYTLRGSIPRLHTDHDTSSD
jgi:hypothetical protein